MRRLLKFLHTAASAGLMGAVAAIAVALMAAHTAENAAESLAVLTATSHIAAWIIGPSLALTVFSGLLAMVVTPAFQDAGWVWAKLATGILLLQAGLHVIGPISENAKRVAVDDASVARLVDAEINTLWFLLAVSLANIALGVWRPRFPKYPV